MYSLTSTFFRGVKRSMKLGKTELKISRQGLGCMSMSEFYGNPLAHTEAFELIKTAFNNGINFFDTADVYGYGDNEVLIGQATKMLIDEGAAREDIIIATKGGILRDKNDASKRGTNNSYLYIKQACQSSLERLGESVKYIDLYYLHRIANNGAQIEEAMKAMAELLNEGKIKAVGLSEASSEVIKFANSSLLKFTNGKHQIAALQTEYSILTRTVEQNGVLDLCRELNITFVAYSPLSRALLTGKISDVEQLPEGDFRRQLPRFQSDNLAYNKSIVEKVEYLSEQKGCTTAQIALAWVLSHKGVVPIPGTTKVSNLLANIKAENIELTKEDVAYLNTLGQAQGTRYTEAAMKAYGLEEESKNRLK